jgi:hypothetical protein
MDVAAKNIARREVYESEFTYEQRTLRSLPCPWRPKEYNIFHADGALIYLKRFSRQRYDFADFPTFANQFRRLWNITMQ